MNCIITGASSNHYKSLRQLLNSINKYQSNSKIIVWDLGLSTEEIHALNNEYNIIMHTFNYKKYPDFFDIKKNAGQYAWKPNLIKETADIYGKNIYLWLDAGDLLVTNIDSVFDFIKDVGFFSNQTDGTLQKWGYETTFINMNKSKDMYKDKLMRNGAVVGFDYSRDWVKEYIEKWAEYALNKNIIAPEGSSRLNHRQDQTLLTILYWDYDEKYKFDPGNLFTNNIHIHQDCD